MAEDWSEWIARARATVEREPEDAFAWKEIALILGDLHRNEEGLLVALQADSLAPRDPRIGAHIAMFLMDLGLGAQGPNGVRPDWERLAAWKEAQIAKYGATLEDAAWAILRALG